MGRLVGPFGVQGWLKVNPFTGTPEALFRFQRWVVRTRDGRVAERTMVAQIQRSGDTE